MVRTAWRHAETSERNSLSGEQLPGVRVTVHNNPAHNGEALPGCHAKDVTHCRRVMPWEALCTEPLVRGTPRKEQGMAP